MADINNNITDLYIYSVAFIMIIVVFILVYNTRKPLTTQNYVSNTYIYIILAMTIASLVNLIMDKYQLLSIEKNYIQYILIFVFSIIMLFAIFFTDKQYIGLRHVYWLLYVISMGAIMYPLYETASTDILWKSFITVIIILIGLTIISSKYPPSAFNSWFAYLMIGLMGLIIFQLFDLIMVKHENRKTEKIFAIISVIIFCGFILYDTKKIHQNAETAVNNCKDLTKHLLCADYPQESLGLFLDLLNLFSSFTNLQRN